VCRDAWIVAVAVPGGLPWHARTHYHLQLIEEKGCTALGWSPTNGKVSPFADGSRDIDAEMAAGVEASKAA
jgi:hypothetical protein